jgi:hypothetical protein
MLVAGVAALLVVLGGIVVRRSEAGLSSGLVRSDPICIIQAVVTGVSFLGAGTILRRRAAHQVEGLTTATSILFAAAVGICVALSQWVLALGEVLERLGQRFQVEEGELETERFGGSVDGWRDFALDVAGVETGVAYHLHTLRRDMGDHAGDEVKGGASDGDALFGLGVDVPVGDLLAVIGDGV